MLQKGLGLLGIEGPERMECYLRRRLPLSELDLDFNCLEMVCFFFLYSGTLELLVRVLVDGLVRVETYVDDPRLGETL
ncbi:hypothetical protein BSZ32_07080 [Rubritalea profundi]|uniref:Uncharacterized protein n=1 Tax=Rubritalea profundi TaxID=1658618 RepID=A0A2S7U1M7_9BACT|nr:hypothetical protein BSZ32_07080 [Rubritalea profundi]